MVILSIVLHHGADAVGDACEQATTTKYTHSLTYLAQTASCGCWHGSGGLRCSTTSGNLSPKTMSSQRWAQTVLCSLMGHSPTIPSRGGSTRPQRVLPSGAPSQRIVSDEVVLSTGSCLRQLVSVGHWRRSAGGVAGLNRNT